MTDPLEHELLPDERDDEQPLELTNPPEEGDTDGLPADDEAAQDEEDG